MSGPVESHVFEEMCQTVLFRGLKGRPNFLGDVEISPVSGLPVVEDVVCQSIGKDAVPYLRVERQRLLCVGNQDEY